MHRVIRLHFRGLSALKEMVSYPVSSLVSWGRHHLLPSSCDLSCESGYAHCALRTVPEQCPSYVPSTGLPIPCALCTVPEQYPSYISYTRLPKPCTLCILHSAGTMVALCFMDGRDRPPLLRSSCESDSPHLTHSATNLNENNHVYSCMLFQAPVLDYKGKMPR